MEDTLMPTVTALQARSFDFSLYTVTAYTFSDCWVLAYALHLHAGLPIVVVGCNWDGSPVTDSHIPTNGQWGHMAVRIPGSDMIVDVEGVHTEGAFLKKWKFAPNDNIHKVNMKSFDILVSRARRNFSDTEANLLAQAIIKKISPNPSGSTILF